MKPHLRRVTSATAIALLCLIMGLSAVVQAVPPNPIPTVVVRAALPHGAEWEGTIAKDDYRLIWYHFRHKPEQHYLTICRKVRGRLLPVRTVPLKKEATSYADDEWLNNAEGPGEPDWDWLLPRQKSGPILTLRYSFWYDTFYVFP